MILPDRYSSRTFGETPVAVVVAPDGEVDLDEVERVYREQLASYKRPRHTLVRREPLPRNANAKVLKRCSDRRREQRTQ